MSQRARAAAASGRRVRFASGGADVTCQHVCHDILGPRGVRAGAPRLGCPTPTGRGLGFYDRYDVRLTDFWTARSERLRRGASRGGFWVPDEAGLRVDRRARRTSWTRMAHSPERGGCFPLRRRSMHSTSEASAWAAAWDPWHSNMSHFNGNEVTPPARRPSRGQLRRVGHRRARLAVHGREGAIDPSCGGARAPRSSFRSILTTPAGRTFSPGETVRLNGGVGPGPE